MKLSKIAITVCKVEHLGNEGTFQTKSEQRYQASSSYKGSGVIKRRQSDGKRERTQITSERIEDTFARTLATARKLERIEKVETFKAERSKKQKQDRIAYRLNKRK